MSENGFHVLLVEDDASVRNSVAAVLRDEGYAVETAADGKQAMETLKAGTDLVLADLMMPNVDGRELLRWGMQNHPGTAGMLMTGYGTIPQAGDAIKAGGRRGLTKRLNRRELVGLWRKNLGDETFVGA